MGPHVALDKGAELLSCTERIARNPVAFDRLCSDPLGELERCGVQVDTKLIKELVGLPGAADADLLDLVRTRDFHAGRRGFQRHQRVVEYPEAGGRYPRPFDHHRDDADRDIGQRHHGEQAVELAGLRRGIAEPGS